jgi:cation diffusion facilitator CzcD-associated flavoprotein CzcO
VPSTPAAGAPDLDVLVVGAGFAGMYLLHRLRRLGLRARVLEVGGGVGGTWYWNRYPGARCDVESMEYSFSFDDDLQQEWNWSERYAAQPEILAYANHVADRFDLRPDISLDTRVEAAAFDADGHAWRLETTRGAIGGRFLVLATGCLSSPNRPRLPGEERFQGQILHTGRWPHEPVDFTGRRVAVIGTGSSAVQAIPVIAREAASVTVFQRTATYAVPAHNRPLDPAERAALKARYPEIRAAARTRRNYINFDFNPQSALAVSPEEREREYQARWDKGGLCLNGAFADQMIDATANRRAAEFVRRKIREIVHDPATADLLSPRTIIGCKRLCVENGYYEAFNRPNVELIDISDQPIEGLTETGIRAVGRDFAVDTVVMATGFDAMTGSILKIDPVGPDGTPLSAAWAEGPKSYLGLAVAGFPNLLTITGPGSPSVLSNMLMSIEQHVDWLADCLANLQARGLTRIEATPEAQEAWVHQVATIAAGTLFPSCNSWYMGSNIPGKPRVFMPFIGCPPYREICDGVAAEGYRGFTLA